MTRQYHKKILNHCLQSKKNFPSNCAEIFGDSWLHKALSILATRDRTSTKPWQTCERGLCLRDWFSFNGWPTLRTRSTPLINLLKANKQSYHIASVRGNLKLIFCQRFCYKSFFLETLKTNLQDVWAPLHLFPIFSTSASPCNFHSLSHLQQICKSVCQF